MGSVASAHNSASASARRDLRRTYQNAPPATAPTASTTFHFTRPTLATVFVGRSDSGRAQLRRGTVSVYEATPGGIRRRTPCSGRVWRAASQPTTAQPIRKQLAAGITGRVGRQSEPYRNGRHACGGAEGA